MKVRGAFNELLRPGLGEIFKEAYSYPVGTLGYKISSQMLADDLYKAAERRTGVSETQIGVESRLGISRRPLNEAESYPPSDWPSYP